MKATEEGSQTDGSSKMRTLKGPDCHLGAFSNGAGERDELVGV